MTRRARSGHREPSVRRQVGLTLPRHLKEQVLAAAAVMDWSAGDWVLAAAAEYGRQVPGPSQATHGRKRPRVPDATFCALYLTPDERDELDDQARDHGLNRSAFVTASAQLALGASRDDVRRGLQEGVDVPLRTSTPVEPAPR